MDTSFAMDNPISRLPDPEAQPDFYARVPAKRLLAWLIDVTLVAILCILALPFTAFTGLFFFPAMMLTVGFVYRVMTLASGSATWGMRLMAIELRDLRDRPFDLSSAFLHTAGYTVSWAAAPLQLISVVLMGCTARGQSLTDMFLGSTALNRRNRG